MNPITQLQYCFSKLAAKVNSLSTSGSSAPVVQNLLNGNDTIAAGTTVARIPAISTSKFYELPLASGYPNGSTLTILDSAGTLSSSVVANISSATDIINGANPLILSTPYASPVLISNGVDKWTLDIRGVSRGGTGATDAAGARTNLGLGTGNSPTFLSQSLTGQSLTGTQATSLLDLTTTWLSTTGTPTAIKLNVTDTASNAASNLMDLQVGGVSKFTVGKTGAINANANFTISGSIVQSSGNVIPSASLILDYFNQDVKLSRDAAGILAQRNGTIAQAFRVYNTLPSSGSTAGEWFEVDWQSTVSTVKIGSNRGVTGNRRAFNLCVDGNAYFGLSKDGASSGAWWCIATSGHLITNSHNAYDIGATGGVNCPRNIYVGTSVGVGVGGWIKVTPVAVASLPAFSTAGVGARAFVNDALSPVFGSPVTAGGSATVPVYSTGSAWNVG